MTSLPPDPPADDEGGRPAPPGAGTAPPPDPPPWATTPVPAEESGRGTSRVALPPPPPSPGTGRADTPGGPPPWMAPLESPPAQPIPPARPSTVGESGMTAPPEAPVQAPPPTTVVPPPPDASWQAGGPRRTVPTAAWEPVAEPEDDEDGAAEAAIAPGADWIGGPPTYPVSVLFERPRRNGRLYAVPVVGGLVRLLLLLPSLIVLTLIGLVAAVAVVPLSLIVLVSGRLPRWGYRLIGGWIRWSARLQAFLFGLTDQYPPFRLGN